MPSVDSSTTSAVECYSLPAESAREQIGAEHLEKLCRLAKKFYGTAELKHFRIAPSIVVRGEAELLGMSVPRFACRVYLKDDKTAFVNVRRLAVLCSAAKEHLTDGAHAATDVFQDALLQLMKPISDAASNCAADSLLALPDNLTSYHVLTAELGAAYGEQAPTTGTPYVSHLEIFGGGMCAQAVAFQATALWLHCARGLYGISEITLLGDTGDPEWINLGGMTPDKLLNYFCGKRVGLRAQHQYPDDSHDLRQQVEQFSDALFAYVSSGIPVILPVDINRMDGDVRAPVAIQGQPIFERNELEDVYRRCWKPGDSCPHAVLVVGSRSHNGVHDFLVNCPATLPFLRASGEELAEARRYIKTAADRYTLGPLSFIPITPREVRLPLLNASDELPVKLGLREIAESLQRHGNRDDWPQEPSYQPGHFRLFDLRSSQPQKLRQRFEDGNVYFPADALSFLKRLVEDEVVPKKWCWGQYHRCADGREHLWVWDAEKPPPSPLDAHPDANAYWLASGTKVGSLWTVINRKPLPELKTAPEPPAKKPLPELRRKLLLAPALISSFATDGVLEAARHWLPGVGCELYLWMQSDLDHFFADYQAEPGAFAVNARMAQLADNHKAIEQIARRLHDQKLPLIGFASFIPEITARPDSARGKRSQLAIRFLAQLALKLKSLQRTAGEAPQLKVIELVAGSRIERIFRVTPLLGDGGDDHLARKLSDAEARRRIQGNLVHAIPRGSDLAQGLKDDAIALALELEPGPLFALRDWKTARDLAVMIEGDDHLRGFVGLNLDVAHWRIAGNDGLIDRLYDDELVRRSIVHAHIAGHSPKAHLGDIALSILNEPSEDFLPWLRLLQFIYEEREFYPNRPFSGFISHEFEAALSSEHVRQSVERLQKLLTEI